VISIDIYFDCAGSGDFGSLLEMIHKLPESIKRTECNGRIEAAHIKARVDGGSDKLEKEGKYT